MRTISTLYKCIVEKFIYFIIIVEEGILYFLIITSFSYKDFNIQYAINSLLQVQRH